MRRPEDKIGSRLSRTENRFVSVREAELKGSTHSIEVIILFDQLLELRLNIDYTLRRKVELHDRNPSFLEILKEPDF